MQDFSNHLVQICYCFGFKSSQNLILINKIILLINMHASGGSQAAAEPAESQLSLRLS